MTAGRTIALPTLIVVLVVAVVAARQVAIGRSEVDMADLAVTRGDWQASIIHARAAAEALAPGSPWTERGWARLEAIGRDAEARGDREIAWIAYGAMRSAAMATRGPWSAWQRRRAQADEALARVAAADRDATARRSP